ncbi:MAG: hypothetical protein WCI11_07795 [Candidatus Methylumidiphilus sp.]
MQATINRPTGRFMQAAMDGPTATPLPAGQLAIGVPLFPAMRATVSERLPPSMPRHQDGVMRAGMGTSIDP